MKSVIALLLSILTSVLSKKPVAVPTVPESAPWSVPSLALIKRFEGLRLQAYKCPADVWTIGWGHTKTVTKGMIVTEKGAEALLRKDVAWVKRTVDDCIKVPMSPQQLAAVYSFIYNVGAGAFRTSTMLGKLNKGDYIGASDEFKRWNKAGGKVLKGLVRRRQAEAQVFRSGYAR